MPTRDELTEQLDALISERECLTDQFNTLTDMSKIELISTAISVNQSMIDSIADELSKLD